jgi:hypothetical protein
MTAARLGVPLFVSATTIQKNASTTAAGKKSKRNLADKSESSPLIVNSSKTLLREAQ